MVTASLPLGISLTLAQVHATVVVSVLGSNWAASLTPSRSDLLLDLAAIWQAVLRVPDRAARPFNAKDVSGGWLQQRHRCKSTPIWGQIGDTFGKCPLPRNIKSPELRGFLSGPCRNRTCNLGIKSPLLCQLS